MTVLAALAVASAAHAHAFAPSLLELREGAQGAVAVRWKTPRLRAIGSEVRPALPDGCRDLTPPRVEETESAVTQRWHADCGTAGLIGRPIAIEGLATANSNGLIRVMLGDGRVIQQVVTSAAPALVIPAPLRVVDLWLAYGGAGVKHVLGRPDRILFLLGLFLLARSGVLMAKTLVAFTLGHSLTLPAATLGLVAIPSRSIEIVLAITVLVLATELAREPSQAWMRRFPWVMGSVFGLLHGLGFAAALHDIGLPGNGLPLALCAFNVGLEVGQVALVVMLLVARRGLRAWPRPLPSWAYQVPVYAIGSLGAFWCFERAAALLR